MEWFPRVLSVTAGVQVGLAAVLFAAVALAALTVVFAVRGRRKRAVAAGVAVALLCGGTVAWWAFFGRDSTEPPVVGSVTVSVDASAALAYGGDAVEALEFPADGRLLAAVEVPLREGDSVLSVLRRTAEQEGLLLAFDGGYLVGIDGLTAFLCGDESGWTFAVNGEQPTASAADIFPSPGDRIVWTYITSYDFFG